MKKGSDPFFIFLPELIAALPRFVPAAAAAPARNEPAEWVGREGERT
jgi:hypothetical protein